jgi:hypothetical protein
MPATPSITLVKTMDYRGVPEEWSNKYHFTGDTPADPVAWKALADALWAEERKFLCTTVKIAAAYGYAAGNVSSVFQLNFTDPPNVQTSGVISATPIAPGDAAGWVRWKTGERNTKGRPIYLRKYFHGLAVTAVDSINFQTRTAMIAYGAKMTDGTLPGTFRVCGPLGSQAGVVKVPTFITTRTLKRRGKDPS